MPLANEVEHLPPLKPLRISKSRRKVDSSRSHTDSLNNTGPPCCVPRRHSSYAIRSSTPRSVAPGRNDTTDTRRDIHHSGSPGVILRNSYQAMELADLHPEPVADTRGYRNNGALKGGLFARAMHALDFRSRQASGDNGNPARGVRSSTYPKSLFPTAKRSNTDLKRHEKLKENDKPVDGSLRVSGPARKITSPLPDGSLHVSKTRAKGSSRSIQGTPFTMASMKLAIDSLKTRSGPDLSTWVSVVIAAKINGLGDTSAADVPLDVMILVDNSARISSETLKGACRNAFQVAASLDRLTDRLAVGCISSDPVQNLNILLPLCSYNLDTARHIFRSLPAFQYDGLSQARFTGAIKEASSFLLRHSSRGALRHIFLVTANSRIHISEDASGNQIRFHTISPGNAVVMNSEKCIEGWHISTSFDDDEGSYIEPAFKDKLKQVVDHLRMGIDSGYLYDLSVDFQPGMGMEMEAILGDRERTVLRLGESWTVLVKVKAITESGYASSGDCETAHHPEDRGHRRTAPTVDDMIDHLQGMLSPDSSMTEPQTLLAATLDYKHSFLPSHTSVRTEGKCEVTHFPHTINCSYNNRQPPHSRCTTSAIGTLAGIGKYDQQGTVKIKKGLRLGNRDECHVGWSDSMADDNHALTDISPNIAAPMARPLKGPCGSVAPFRDLALGRDTAIHPPFASENFQRSKNPYYLGELSVPII